MQTQNDIDSNLDEYLKLALREARKVGVETVDIEAILWEARQKRIMDGINMVPSETRISPKAKLIGILAIHAGLNGRYAEGFPGDRYYPGTFANDALEPMLVDLVKEAFGAHYADIRPPTANNANMAVFLKLTEGGDKVAAYTTIAGGHISAGQVGSLGLRVKVRGRELKEHHLAIPLLGNGYQLDLGKTKEMIYQHRPTVIVVGKSLFLFPEPVGELRKICDETGTIIVYDGAHVSGLIAAGRFQNPLVEGAHIFDISTHKTIPGDQGGAIMTNDQELYERATKGVMPGNTSSHHLHRIAPLIVTFREQKEQGAEYADSVISNAGAFAQSLTNYGLEPEARELGYTRSHQVAINVRNHLGISGKVAQDLLEANSIYANANSLPTDKSVRLANTSGIRTGTQEVTLQGMREEDMDRLAHFYKRVLVDKSDIKGEVVAFARRFPDRYFAR